MQITVTVSAVAHCTEDPAKVEKSIRNLFPRLPLKIITEGEKKVLSAQGEGTENLMRLKRILRSRRIRSAAKSVLSSHIKERMILFHLHKQAAYAGQVSFCQPEGESPLGVITVTIESTDPDRLIDWLTEGKG